jgi:hypothetical protein
MSARSLVPAARLLLAAAMLATAAWMWGHLPTKMQSWAPIAVHGTVGERIEGRNLAVTVQDIQIGREATFTNSGAPVRMSTTGVWLAIGLDYGTLLTDESPAFILRADGKSFESPLSGFGDHAVPGLTDRGVLAFELPEKPSRAELLVYNKTPDRWGNPMESPLDSQISVSLQIPQDVQDSLNLDKVADG